MTVKRTFGKHIVEVSGTEDQVTKYLAVWAEEMKAIEPYVIMCHTIRERAVQLNLPGAKDKPILEILGMFLHGDWCDPPIDLLRASRVFLDWLSKRKGEQELPNSMLSDDAQRHLAELISKIDSILTE